MLRVALQRGPHRRAVGRDGLQYGLRHAFDVFHDLLHLRHERFARSETPEVLV